MEMKPKQESRITYIDVNCLNNPEDLAKIRAAAESGDYEARVYLAEYEFSRGIEPEKNYAFLESCRAKKEPYVTFLLAMMYCENGSLYDEANEEESIATCLSLMEEALDYGSPLAVRWLVGRVTIGRDTESEEFSQRELTLAEHAAEKAILNSLQKDEGIVWHTKPDEVLLAVRKNPAYKRLPKSHHEARLAALKKALAEGDDMTAEERGLAEQLIAHHESCLA